MKVLAGDWPEGQDALVGTKFVAIKKGIFSYDRVPVEDIVQADIVTEENRASIAGKLGWGALGAVALGPLGLLAGVLGGGNKKDRVISVLFKDGRKVLLKGGPRDVETFSKVTFGRAL